MKWSLRLGRFLGIEVSVHITFLVLLGFLTLAHGLAGRSLAAAANGLVFFVGLFGCVLLHEFGHALAARAYGIGTRDITLLPIGGLARLERMPDRPLQELVVALAGPAVNVVIAGGLAAGLLAMGAWQPWSELGTTSGNLAERLLVANVFLALFNLLPAFPMDGGRVVRALLALRGDHVRATRIAARLGQGMAVLFGFAGLFSNPMLLLIALFVWTGAAQELAATEMKSTLGGATVREAMLTEFQGVSPDTSLDGATRRLLAGSQSDFPVVEAGRVVGLLVQADLLQALRERGGEIAVREVMRPAPLVVAPDMLLEEALRVAGQGPGLPLPVVADGALIGLLTAENVGEFLLVRAALSQRPPGRPAPPPGGGWWPAGQRATA